MLVFLSLTLFAVILCTALRMTCLCVKFFRRLPPRAPRTQRTPRRIDSHNLISPLRSLRTCFSPTFACFACHSFSPSTSKTNSTFVFIRGRIFYTALHPPHHSMFFVHCSVSIAIFENQHAHPACLNLSNLISSNSRSGARFWFVGTMILVSCNPCRPCNNIGPSFSFRTSSLTSIT